MALTVALLGSCIGNDLLVPTEEANFVQLGTDRCAGAGRRGEARGELGVSCEGIASLLLSVSIARAGVCVHA